jgi:hypothetical protein
MWHALQTIFQQVKHLLKLLFRQRQVGIGKPGKTL